MINDSHIITNQFLHIILLMMPIFIPRTSGQCNSFDIVCVCMCVCLLPLYLPAREGNSIIHQAMVTATTKTERMLGTFNQ